MLYDKKNSINDVSVNLKKKNWTKSFKIPKEGVIFLFFKLKKYLQIT